MLVVVFSILLVNTITEKTPLIFLKLGEKTTGEIDAIVSPGFNEGVYNDKDYDNFFQYGIFLNYTRVHEIAPDDNFAPRKLLTDAYFQGTEDGKVEAVKGTITAIKTDLEKEIELGIEYPYGPLQKGQCVMAK